MIVLGLTGGFHMGSCDAAATVIKHGVTVASVEEERLTRNKNSFSIPPSRCIKSALDIAGIGLRDVERVVLYVDGYAEAEHEMRDHFIDLFGFCPKIEMVNHHLCHAASAFYASGYDEATVVTFDWSGEVNTFGVIGPAKLVNPVAERLSQYNRLTGGAFVDGNAKEIRLVTGLFLHAVADVLAIG